jgi:hypothetical protein
MKYTKIINAYIHKHQANAARERRYFRIQKKIKDAISLAALAKMPNGKRFHHQRRIPKKVLLKCEKVLLTNSKLIKTSSSFDDLHSLIKMKIGNIFGVGELMIYDTSFRIGSYLNLEPNVIYLHAGTRKGAEYLGIKNRKIKFIHKRQLPIEFNKLRPYEIEDVLCIYKKALKEKALTTRSILTGNCRGIIKGLSKNRVHCGIII